MKSLLPLAVALAFAIPAAAAPVWLKGDLHVHDDHSSDGSAPRQRNRDRAKGNVAVSDQIGQATRMGLEFLPLTDHRTFDQQYDPLWESRALLLIPGEEANGSPHANVFGAADSIVQGAARADRGAFTHVQQSVWNAHSQGAAWSVNHPDDGETDKDTGVPNAMASVQGMDLVEIWNKASDGEKEIDYSENRWNAGFRFGVAGASDSHFREYWDRQGPGYPTTRLLAPGRTERGVIAGLRAGRTSLSLNPSDPFVELTTDLGGGGMGGDEVYAPKGTRGRLTIRVRGGKAMQVLVYRQPGRRAGPIRTFEPSTDDQTFTVAVTAAEHPDWFRVELRGPGAATPATPPALELKALTSPLFISPGPVSARPEIAIPEDQGKSDGAIEALGARGAFAGFADIAVADGRVHLVAESQGTSSTIVYRRGDPTGRWTSQARPLSGAGEARFPKVAARGRNVWVVWQEDAVQVPHRPAIRLRHSLDGGATWGPARTIRSLDGRAEHPDIDVGAVGPPVVVWQEIRAAQPFDVMVQDIGVGAEPRNLSRPGKAFGLGAPDDSRSARYPASVWPAVAVAPDGRVAVAWQDNRTDIDPLWTGSEASAGTNPDDWQIQVTVRAASGGWTLPFSLGAADMAERHPDLAFDTSGALVVVWESKTLAPAGRNLAVLAAASRDSGATYGSPSVLGPDPATMSERPRLGRDADGAVRAVWYDSRSADWRWRVMTSAFRAGAWDGGRMLDGRGNNSWPVTAGGVIAFSSTRNARRLQRDSTQQVFLLAPRLP